MTNERDWLADRFEEHREHLRGVAFRLLGSASDADDAVQEAWLRASRADPGDVANLRAWLTTVVARISLNVLRSRAARREERVETDVLSAITGGGAPGFEQEVALADSVGLALLVVLERLTPAERLAFVLHDMFDLPFEEIAPIVGRSPVAARQLASRARRRVRGAGVADDTDIHRRREVVDAFLAASRRGDFGALLTLLDPDVMLRIDEVLQRRGAPGELRGATLLLEQARHLTLTARFCEPVLVDGSPGLLLAPRGRLLRALVFSFVGDRIAGIEVIADPARLRRLDISIPEPAVR